MEQCRKWRSSNLHLQDTSPKTAEDQTRRKVRAQDLAIEDPPFPFPFLSRTSLPPLHSITKFPCTIITLHPPILPLHVPLFAACSPLTLSVTLTRGPSHDGDHGHSERDIGDDSGVHGLVRGDVLHHRSARVGDLLPHRGTPRPRARQARGHGASPCACSVGRNHRRGASELRRHETWQTPLDGHQGPNLRRLSIKGILWARGAICIVRRKGRKQGTSEDVVRGERFNRRHRRIVSVRDGSIDRLGVQVHEQVRKGGNRKACSRRSSQD